MGSGEGGGAGGIGGVAYSANTTTGFKMLLQFSLLILAVELTTRTTALSDTTLGEGCSAWTYGLLVMSNTLVDASAVLLPHMVA